MSLNPLSNEAANRRWLAAAPSKLEYNLDIRCELEYVPICFFIFQLFVNWNTFQQLGYTQRRN